MMNRVLGFASLGLAVLALAVALSGPPQVVVSTPGDERPSSTSTQDVQELEKRVKALEDTVVSLSTRMMALERRPAASDGSGGAMASAAPAALAQEVEQLKTEVRSLIAGEALNSQGGREYLKEMVRSVQDEMRTTQRQERQQQWAQAQTQAQTERSERLRKFVSEAGLNYSQEQEFTRRMQEEESRRQALTDEVSAGTKSQRDVGQELRAMRTQTDEAMQKLLSESQRTQYEELRREDRGQRRPGRGRPDAP
jgi:chromosome segregation ATPase